MFQIKLIQSRHTSWAFADFSCFPSLFLFLGAEQRDRRVFFVFFSATAKYTSCKERETWIRYNVYWTHSHARVGLLSVLFVWQTSPEHSIRYMLFTFTSIMDSLFACEWKFLASGLRRSFLSLARTGTVAENFAINSPTLVWLSTIFFYYLSVLKQIGYARFSW